MGLTDGLKRDYLTSCYTRDGFSYVLQELAKQSQASNRPFSILITDVDHFKKYNDGFGHLVGDQIIQFFSNCLSTDTAGSGAIVFRFGGDEFVVVVPDCDDQQLFDIGMVINKNLKQRAFKNGNNNVYLTFSGGVSCYPTDGSDVAHILERADKALYASKRRGRDRVTCFKNVRNSDRGFDQLKKFKKSILVFLTAVLVAEYLILGSSISTVLEKAFHRSAQAVSAWRVKQTKSLKDVELRQHIREHGVMIYQKSGRTIQAAGYEIQGDTLKVNLNVGGGRGVLKFPLNSIDRIVSGDKVLEQF